MAIVVTPPEKVGFSKDVILWRFEDDRAGITPGITAVAYFSVGNPVLDGTQIIFRWGNNDLRFTARETVGEYGNEIPTFPEYSEEAHEAYIKSLVPYFKDNFYLDRDFDIEAVGVSLFGVVIWVVQFTAKNRGSAYNFANTSFAGGGMSMYVEGKDDSVIANNSVYVEVWVQNPEGSIFELKYGAPQLFDTKSIAEFDVASVLHTCLASEVPDMTLPIAERCTQSRRKYYLRYALFGGTPPSIGPIQTTEEFVVLLGGFAQWEGPKSLIDHFRISATESKLMKIRPALRTVRIDEPVFVSWLNLGAAGRNIHASAKVTFADGTEILTNTGVVTNIHAYDKLIFGVGFKQLYLTPYLGQGRTISEFTIQLRDDLGPVSDAYRLVVDYGHREYVRYFAHVNSYGCIETLMTYGKSSSHWKVFKEQAQKVMPYRFPTSEPQFVEWNATYQDNQEVATGWMRRKDLILWLDLFIAALKYRVINGKPYAIQINSDTIQKGADGDNQHALTFEYQFSRIFDSVNEELLEGEDQADIIPPNIVLAGSQNAGGAGGGTASPPPPAGIYVDPYPISGSRNAVSSDGVFRTLEQFQKKLPKGDPDQYVNGEHQLRSMRQAVISNETDPTVPPYAKTLNSVARIATDLQALPEETGLNVPKLGGHTAEWYIRRASHPSFDQVPPVVVEKGKDFVKYLNLATYKTSYHPLEEMDVEIVFNTLKLQGVQVTADDQLMITIKGKLNEELSDNENVLLIVRDLVRNQGVVALRIHTLDEPEQPENPDNRPVCAKGPFHYEKTAIAIANNGEFICPFDATGVDPIAWVICTTQDAASPLRSGQSNALGGPFFKATFPPLPGGEYWIGIRGVLCKSNWAWRKLVLPTDTTLQFATDYPKHVSQGSDSAFLAKMTLSGTFLTEVLNLSTNTKVYSQTHDYVADSTEIPIVKSGGWPEANYRISVGTASANVKVGNPPTAPSQIFKLVTGWDGDLIADLSAGPYTGSVPATGFNAFFQADETAVTFQFYRLKAEKEVAGSFELVTSAGSSAVAGAPSTVVPPLRLFPAAGVDSRSIMFQGQSLNTIGKLRITLELRSGTTESSPLVKSYQQIIQLNELKIYGGWGNTASPGARIVPVVGGVRYNGVNVINNNVWTEPWASSGLGVRRMEYSFDKATWYPTSAFFDGFGGATESSLQLLNSATYSNVDLFPPGSKKTIYLRDGLNHAMISPPYVINQSGAVGGELSAKSFARGYWHHIQLEKVYTANEVLFNDLDDALPDEGFIFWYSINREIVKTPTPLTGYPYPKGKPWGVYKAMVQIGYNGTLAPWHGADGSNENLARPFPHNSSVAFDCGVQNKK